MKTIRFNNRFKCNIGQFNLILLFFILSLSFVQNSEAQLTTWELGPASDWYASYSVDGPTNASCDCTAGAEDRIVVFSTSISNPEFETTRPHQNGSFGTTAIFDIGPGNSITRRSQVAVLGAFNNAFPLNCILSCGDGYSGSDLTFTTEELRPPGNMNATYNPGGSLLFTWSVDTDLPESLYLLTWYENGAEIGSTTNKAQTSVTINAPNPFATYSFKTRENVVNGAESIEVFPSLPPPPIAPSFSYFLPGGPSDWYASFTWQGSTNFVCDCFGGATDELQIFPPGFPSSAYATATRSHQPGIWDGSSQFPVGADSTILVDAQMFPSGASNDFIFPCFLPCSSTFSAGITSFTTEPLRPPGNMSVVRNPDGSLTFNWTVATDLPEPEYLFTWYENGEVAGDISNKATTSLTIQNPQAVIYSFRTRVNAPNGAKSVEVIPFIPPPSPSPPMLTATDDSSDYFIDIDWLFPVNPCLYDATGNPYDVITTRLMRDGQEINFETYDTEALQSSYRFYAPIKGSYRDFVGPGQNHSYTMLLFVGPFGNVDLDCSGISDAGSTSMTEAPDQFTVSTDLLDRINISWVNKSDLATSYKLFRDGELIATITEGVERDSILSFEDVYSFTNISGIQSGKSYTYTIEMFSSYINQSWPYPVGQGNTLDLNFDASDGLSDKVVLEWLPTASGQIDQYQIYRDDKLFSVKSNNEISFIDTAPHYGDSIDYTLRLIKNDTVKAAFQNDGFVSANGSISGRVVTQEGLFPVENVTVSLTRQSNGEVLSTTSNGNGGFSFMEIPYGLLDSFELNATLVGHTFMYPNKTIGLSANGNTFANAIILDDFIYEDGAEIHSIALNPTVFEDEDHVVLDWLFDTESSEVFIDLLRNGEVLYSTLGQASESGFDFTFSDLGGIPKEENKYQIRIYSINGNEVSEANAEATVIFPAVSRIDDGNLTIAEENISSMPTGNVQLNWSHASSNIDAFRIYRNDTLVAEVDSSLFSYIDTEAPFDEDLFYTITAIRKLGQVTYETEDPTASIPTSINLGILPAPNGATANPISSSPYILLYWNKPAAISSNPNFNYTGYYIYRNGKRVGSAHKSQGLRFNDFFASGQTDAQYEVSLYRALEDVVFESERVQANLVDHPLLENVPDLTAVVNASEGRVDLSWDDNSITTINFDGFQILYKENIFDTTTPLEPLEKTGPYTSTFVHYPPQGSSPVYYLYRYKTADTTDYLSTTFSSQSVTISPSSGVVYAPQNVTASRNLPNHVKVCWEYLDFIESSFEIYRDGVLLDTLPVGSRSFYDYEADPFNQNLGYQVRAVQSGQSSIPVGAVGDIIDPKMIFGSVLDAATQRGVPNIRVSAVIGPKSTIRAQTDSSGYFEFMLPNDLNGANVTINAFYNAFDYSQSIMLSTDDHYYVEIPVPTPTEFQSTRPAVISFAEINVDIYELTGNVHWQASNENYDGVEVRRGVDIIADVPKANGNVFVDVDAVPGIKYFYQFRAYRNTDVGKVFSAYFQKEVTYPALASVVNLTATPLQDQNAVKVQWSHLYDHADGYLITRNDAFISEVIAGNPFTFTDSTGIAGEQYTYTLTAYKVVGGQVYYSSEESVTVTYPAPAKVSNLILSIPFIPNVDIGGGIIEAEYQLNHVLISWDYPAADGNGFKVYRDDELIATLPLDSTSFQDYLGIPEVPHTYSVVAIVSQNGVANESNKSSDVIPFPQIERPYLASATSRPAVGDAELKWKYRSEGIDGFHIFNVSTGQLISTISNGFSLSDLTFNTFIDQTSAPGSLTYLIQPFAIRNGVEYLSEGVSPSVIYPYPPVPTGCSASQGAYYNAVEFTWEYPVEANVDSFLIQRTDVSSGQDENIAIIESGKRKYVDFFGAEESTSQYDYSVVPLRFLANDEILAGPDCVSNGYPGSANDPDNIFSNSAGTSFGRSVAVDKEWMVAGAAFDGAGGKIYIYKFESGEWIFKQEFSGNPGVDFGWAVDIDDKLIIAGAPDYANGDGAFNTYRLYNGVWYLDKFTPNDGSGDGLGYSVSIDNEVMVVGHRSRNSENPLSNMYQKAIRVFQRPASCTYDVSCASYTEIPVTNTVLPGMDRSLPHFTPYRLGFTVDLDGTDIVVGAPEAYYFVPLSGLPTRRYGLVAHYKIESGNVNLKSFFSDEVAMENDLEENFGWDVEFENRKIAVSSKRAVAPNGNSGGKVSLFEYFPEDGGAWLKFQSLYSDAPLNQTRYSECIKWKDDYLLVSEPLITPDFPASSKLFLYKENPNTNLFEILQSPDPNSELYREEFFDSGDPNIYPISFGYVFDISDNHIVVGTNANLTPKVYPFDLFNVSIDNLTASDGTFTNTKVSWDLGGCEGCPADYIEAFRVYRDAELIGQVDGNSTSFFDVSTDLVQGASVAISGKEYIYEVEAKMNAPFEYTSPKAVDIGYAKRKGKLSGKVLVTGTVNGVPGVTISMKGVDTEDNSTYEYTTTTLSDGSYVVNDIYVGTGVTYEVTPSFEDHDFLAVDGNFFLFTPDAFDKSNILFFDNTAYVINGRIYRQGSLCNLPEITVKYYQTINGTETLVDTTTSDQNGNYSIIIKPNLDNLDQIKIKVEHIQQSNTEQGDTSLIQYHFAPDEKTFTAFNNFPIVTTCNFMDDLTYPISFSVENTCGSPVADQPVEIRIASLDGCYEFTIETDEFGKATMNLPPKDYLFAINELLGSGVDNYENAAIDFLKLRPVKLNLLALHMEAEDGPLPSIDPVKFIYHRAVNFVYTSSFDRYLCDDTQNPAIITQGERHSLDFILSEDHRPGESCEVSEGYLIIRNSGAEVPIDTLQFGSGFFPTYQFTAGLPNLVAPHTLAISIQYFSDQGSLLGSKIIPILIEGQRPLPGTGIITDALTDEAGDLLMPLLVLRDPPGDGSYSSIESGTTISKSLEIEAEDSGSFGLYVDGTAAFFGAGVFGELNTGGGGGNSNSSTLEFSITTTQAFATSDSEDAIGREANVIVGAGISNQYGLTQILTFKNNCTPQSRTNLSFGIGGFNSTFGYTVAFIEGLIKEYKRDSTLVENDLLDVVRPDGSFYTKEEARERFTALIASWSEMMHYHDVETVPHYVLCSDFSYRDSLSQAAIALYDDWKNEFCGQIGSYEGDKFTMDDEIIWTPTLISSYNNVIAFTDNIKGLYLSEIENGDLALSNNEITSNNLNVTNQFHNTLGNAAKSAEVFDISGNVNFDRTITAQQSSSTSKSFSRYFYLDAAFGAAIEIMGAVGLGFLQNIADVEAKIGVRIKADASISVSKAQAQSNESTISYHIFDDDPEDQVTFLALQAPLQDQTPFFIRLGGLSSCPPEEALTINQDNDPLLIDDPTMTVIIDPISGAATPNPPPVYDVEPVNAAIFQVQMGNLGPTGQTRDAKVFLDLESNPFGAIIKIGGSNLNIVSPEFSIPAGGSITQFLTVERPPSTPFYDFEGLRIGIEPACGGEAKFITLDVYFKSPCSPVSVTKPFQGFVVNRINPNISNDREVIPYEIRDYQSGNMNLEHIQLQYKRLGTGTDWQNVPGGLIQRPTLAASDAGLALGQDPLYFFEWDITGQYNLYPDGAYMVRALAFCGTSGIQYSNETTITLARSALLITGYPEPADGLWTTGDVISTTYSADIDCGILNTTDSIQQYVSLMDLTTMMPVPFTAICQNNKLTLVPDGPMSLYDGHTLRATYMNIKNIVGNTAQNVIWDFDVVTQSVDWDEPMVEITVFENEMKTISTSLFNTSGTTVTGLTLSGSQAWYMFDPAGTFSVPSNGFIVNLTFDGTVGVGQYTTTLQVNGLPGRTPTIVVNLNVIPEVPLPDVNPNYSDSMDLILNWSFLDPYITSTDLQDVIQVYKDGQMRGYAYIQEQGNFYFARVRVRANAAEENGLLDFVIWNADETQAYTPIASTAIPFNANTVRGILTNPEILLVENDTYQFGNRIYVDSTNFSEFPDGLSWETAFNNLQQALAIANTTDTIWMAKGTYYPSAGDRKVSYELNEGIAIHGGFQTGMTLLSQRTGNDETILSGNIGVKLDSTDNAYHVIKSSATRLLLDMLSIVGGTANGGGDDSQGGCLFNTGTLTLQNCIMRRGAATTSGALIYNDGNIILEGGTYYISPLTPVSNLFNQAGSQITIKQTVEIKEE